MIKSLSVEYIKKVNNIVSEGVLNGKSYTEIMKELRKADKNLKTTRAKLIARDQVAKLNSTITKRRQTDLGIKMYKWITALDERVRPTHKSLHGKICKWDDPNVYAENETQALKGKWKSRSSINAFQGVPGQDILCRCIASPIFLDVINDIEKVLEEGG